MRVEDPGGEPVPPPAVRHVAAGSGPRALLKSVFEGKFLDGQPHCSWITVTTAITEEQLLGGRWRVVGRLSTPMARDTVAVSAVSTLRIAWSPEDTTVWVAAVDHEALQETMAWLGRNGEEAACTDHLGPPPLEVGLWRAGPGSPTRTVREVDRVPWDAISQNYPATTRKALGELAGLRRPESGGRLLLWHGQPGTGKTRAALTLMAEWSGWCDSEVVVDPEQLLAEPAYLTEVLVGSADGGSSRPREQRWRLVVVEDADSLLTGAGRGSSPELGRLLNATDGLLGLGMQALVLVTSNERPERLHPALRRPGRCLAVVEFSRFNRAEAGEWLPEGVAPPSGATLAELYELREGRGRSGRPGQATRTGQYL